MIILVYHNFNFNRYLNINVLAFNNFNKNQVDQTYQYGEVKSKFDEKNQQLEMHISNLENQLNIKNSSNVSKSIINDNSLSHKKVNDLEHQIDLMKFENLNLIKENNIYKENISDLRKQIENQNLNSDKMRSLFEQQIE